MIEIGNLTDADKGRRVRYEREHCKREIGVLSSWNDRFVFVRFNGPNGEACEPADVSFIDPPEGPPIRRVPADKSWSAEKDWAFLAAIEDLLCHRHSTTITVRAALMSEAIVKVLALVPDHFGKLPLKARSCWTVYCRLTCISDLKAESFAEWFETQYVPGKQCVWSPSVGPEIPF